MSRSKHQFRPGMPEIFEPRVVPSTIVQTPGPTAIPFVPPGQDRPYENAPGGGIFSVEQGTNVLTGTLSPSNVDRWITFAVYSAPGGGDSDDAVVGSDYNLSSQTLIHSETRLVLAGEIAVFTVDLDNLKLTGQRKLQCDFFQADDGSGYAPKKLKTDVLDGHLIVGQLFDYSDIDDKGKEKR